MPRALLADFSLLQWSHRRSKTALRRDQYVGGPRHTALIPAKRARFRKVEIVTIKRVQGTSLRVEDCPKGGQHVLTRARQKYCDRCRPEEAAKALERQRRHRGRGPAEHRRISNPAVSGGAQSAANTRINSLHDLEHALSEGMELIERLSVKALAKIEVRIAKGLGVKGVIDRHGDLVVLRELLGNGLARTAHLNRPPLLRNAQTHPSP